MIIIPSNEVRGGYIFRGPLIIDLSFFFKIFLSIYFVFEEIKETYMFGI